jgi:hypothetical protein
MEESDNIGANCVWLNYDRDEFRPETGDLMKSRLTAALTTLGLTVAGVATAVPAHADGLCSITNYSPHSVTIGLSPVVRTFGVSTTGCSTVHWSADGDDFYVYPDSPQDIFYPPYSNSDAGKLSSVVVEATNSDWVDRSKVFYNSFSYKRRTAWQDSSFNASPEPVKKGAAISIKARLLIANWASGHYDAYASRTVAIQFRTPNGTYATVKTAKTASNGWLTTTVPAKQTGVWRVNYGGNSYAGNAVAVVDAVTVSP